MTQYVFSKSAFLPALRRAGYTPETIPALDAALQDKVDGRRDEALLDRYGVSRNAIVDRMGGSP